MNPKTARTSTTAQDSPWSAADVPRLDGRVAVITGANTGIGFETARVLAGHGARVVLACRSVERARAAAARIAASAVAAPEILELDLASLSSVRRAAEQLRELHPVIDLLVNNAGVMDVPCGTTEDGFESHLGINHLGHFALTGLLQPQLTEGSRIVSVSSVVHARGQIDFDDLAYTRDYKPGPAYARSKLANLLFAFELDRRLTAAGSPTASLAAHPGLSRTELYRYEEPVARFAVRLLSPVFMQSAASGALPVLRAATDPAATSGTYYGPSGRKQYKGHPVLVDASPAAHDEAAARRLWDESEKLTGVAFPC
ncbi:MAG TPA: oxidoreductase [Streptosporangiaceae bacterium]|nr:oxidoreductase [Streptosporangiaceae bacterium]